MSDKNKINPEWKNAPYSIKFWWFGKSIKAGPPPNHNLCSRCAGTGIEPDDKAIGGNLKAHRIEAGINLRNMARRINLSHGFLCQLEGGQRHWTPEVIRRYQKELGQ